MRPPSIWGIRVGGGIFCVSGARSPGDGERASGHFLAGNRARITKNTRKCSQKPQKLCTIYKNGAERCIRLSIDNKNRAVYNSEYIRNDEDIRNKEYTPSRGARKTGAYFFICNRLIISMIVT